MLSPPLDDARLVVPTAPLQRSARFDFIDAAKVIGIVLVVLGHAPGAPYGLVTLIYSFHMPLFFFLSGYLQSTARVEAPLRRTIVRTGRALLVPYAFFFALSLLYWMATRHLGARAIKFAGLEPVDALHGFVNGLSGELFINPVLWFFPCLFTCQLLYAVVRRVFTEVSALAVLAAFACALLAFTLPWTLRWPWGLDIAWIAVVFYAAGHAWRVSGWAPRAGKLATGLLALVVIAAWFALATVQGRVDLARANLGNAPLLFLPCAAAGIALTLFAARLLPASNTLRWLSENSLVIFPLHPLLINAASGALKQAGAGPHGPLAWLLLSVWGIVACVPIAWALRRYAPELLGVARPVAVRGVA